MPLKEGDAAPRWKAKDQNGKTHSSDDLTNRRYLIYFYPKDDTPICTREACAFQADRPEFDELGIPVFGVSADTQESHASFATKHGLEFPLLADPERKLVRAFDAAGRLGVRRVTYIVGPTAVIEGAREARLSGAGHVRWAKERLAQVAHA